MDYTQIIGYLAAVGTTGAFLPQVMKTFRTKSTKDISLTMYIFFCTGVFLWIIYGLMVGSWPVILANSIVFILGMIILAMKVRYR